MRDQLGGGQSQLLQGIISLVGHLFQMLVVFLGFLSTTESTLP